MEQLGKGVGQISINIQKKFTGKRVWQININIQHQFIGKGGTFFFLHFINNFFLKIRNRVSLRNNLVDLPSFHVKEMLPLNECVFYVQIQAAKTGLF